MWVWLLAIAAWAADPLDEWFPPDRIEPSLVLARSAELLGPASPFYDVVTITPDAATKLELAIESGSFRHVQPAPDSLRRWGRYMLSMSALGRVPPNAASFAAEHFGLPVQAYVVQYFVGDGQPEDIIGMLKDLDTSELNHVAVVVEHIPDREGVRGMVVATAGAVEFERFPKVWQVGDTATVPGTLLQSRTKYALYVAGDEAEVVSYPLPEQAGVFDIDIPLPQRPGAWNVALDARTPGHFPDSGFYFTLYVGRQPPSAPTLLPVVAEGVSWEDDLLGAINAERLKYGISPLEAAGDRGSVAQIISRIPEKEREAVKYLSAQFAGDPAPTVPHGGWHAASGGRQSVAETAWSALKHPVSRATVLDPDSRFALVASHDRAVGGPYYLALFFKPVESVSDIRKRTLEAVTARSSTPLLPAVVMEPELDALAQAVAGGGMPFKNVLSEMGKRVKQAFQSGTLTGSATMHAFTSAVGELPDLTSLTPSADMHVVSIGVATGAFGEKDGISRVVTLVVVAGGTK